ncbi:MAG: ABC transporter permease [Anaerolineales bacterium]|jgi:peptide/nickel transport system permease protein|nr:ABC transporter permease [Anaerolineales bacterium]
MTAHQPSELTTAVVEIDPRNAAQGMRTPLQTAIRHFLRHRLAVFGLMMITLIGLSVAIGPMLIKIDPNRIEFSEKNESPSLQHPMGTDELGRDQFVRILYGGRTTLMVGVACITVSVTLGVTLGSIAGYSGGGVDNAIMRMVDVFYSLPSLFVVIILMTLVGPGFWTIVISISILRWMTTSRLVRACFLSLKEREFIAASRALGMNSFGIITQHLLPNSIGPVIVSATLNIAGAILTESTLSFLGLGFQPPQATWGRMLLEATKAVIQYGHWWRVFFPGAMLFVTILSINYIGDGLRDALDPMGLTSKRN